MRLSLSLVALAVMLLAPAVESGKAGSTTRTDHLGEFQVIEFRRYAVKPEEREPFARYFESYFPEAFQQLGSLIHGHFLDRADPSGFIWIRGFHDIEARATVNQAFYGGPLWKEHSKTMNDRLIDHTNVLLLQPLQPGRGISVLPAVDPIADSEGARGLVIAQVFAVRAGGVEAFARAAEASFAEYRAAGVREAGVLVTLDVPNNFPGLPFRTDGPYLVWLGVVRDDEALGSQWKPLAERALQPLSATGLLRAAPESIVMQPASRSRLRWLPEWRP
jgi:NIPSNAP